MLIQPESFTGKRFVVTGGLGYIGSSLSSHLADLGAQVMVLDNFYCPSIERFVSDVSIEIVAGDVRDASLMRELLLEADGCFHLAASSRSIHYDTDATAAQEVNVLGTSCVASACFFGHRVPLVFASSAAVYGCQARFPILEDVQCEPLSQYGKDKLRGERIVASLAKHLQSYVTSLRLFNVCGSNTFGFRGDGALARLASTGSLDHRFQVYGSGTQTRDYIHVEDVVRAFLAAMADLLRAQSHETNVYNVCTGTETSVLELIKMTGTRLDACTFVPQEDVGVPRSVGSNKRILSTFGPHSFKPLGKTIAEMFLLESN